jgi:hypothetical protein
MLRIRTITTGQAPQELVDIVRQGMDPEDRGKATDGKLASPLKRQKLIIRRNP